MDSGALLSVILGGLLALFSLAVVGYSFLRGTGGAEYDGATDAGTPAADAGELPLESLYDSLETLQLEYRLGNLPEAQYREQFESYRRQAAAIIKRQLESGGADPELRLEAEVLTRRGLLPQPAPADEFESGSPPSDAANTRPGDNPPPAANDGDSDSDTDNAPDSPGDGPPPAGEIAPAASDNNQPPDADTTTPPGGAGGGGAAR